MNSVARLVIDIPELDNLKEILMSVKTKIESMAAQLDVALPQLTAALNNIAADIQGLTGQLASAATEAQVTALLQPKVDAIVALGTLAAQIAAVVPEGGGTPEGEL
jgi:hypothetical protein